MMRFAESLRSGQGCIGVDGSCSLDKVLEALVYEDSVENIDHCLVNKESLEQEGCHGGALAENEESTVEPCPGTLENA